MPKLILKFDDRELQECGIGVHGVTIGRLPDNMLVIDNAAVSGRHARVYREGERYIVEDLKSTNGTFVDHKPVTRHTLRDGDVMTVGKHTVVFSMAGGEELSTTEREAFIPEIGGTMMLDTLQHKDMMAGIESGAGAKGPTAPAKTERAGAPAQIGMLKVIVGRANESEFTLAAHTAIIGKADTALVRLSGWFKPKMAAAIARKGDGYSVTALGGKVKVNGQPLVGRHDLKDGDIIEVSGLTLQFRLRIDAVDLALGRRRTHELARWHGRCSLLGVRHSLATALVVTDSGTLHCLWRLNRPPARGGAGPGDRVVGGAACHG